MLQKAQIYGILERFKVASTDEFRSIRLPILHLQCWQANNTAAGFMFFWVQTDEL